MWAMAAVADMGWLKVTKPKPRDSPVSLSRITCVRRSTEGVAHTRLCTLWAPLCTTATAHALTCGSTVQNKSCGGHAYLCAGDEAKLAEACKQRILIHTGGQVANVHIEQRLIKAASTLPRVRATQARWPNRTGLVMHVWEGLGHGHLLWHARVLSLLRELLLVRMRMAVRPCVSNMLHLARVQHVWVLLRHRCMRLALRMCRRAGSVGVAAASTRAH